MKILAFADTHGDGQALETIRTKSDNVDLIICAGDLTVFGHEQQKLVDFLDNIGKKVIMLHGNHEDKNSLKKMCDNSKNIKFCHDEIVDFGEIILVVHGGGGFISRSNSFEVSKKKFAEAIKEKKSIFITHAPPYNTKLDIPYKNSHCGSKSYRDFIDEAQPNIAISGHIHECFGKKEKIGKTIAVNPGPKGIIITL